MRFGISATSWIFPKNLRMRLRPANVLAILDLAPQPRLTERPRFLRAGSAVRRPQPSATSHRVQDPYPQPERLKPLDGERPQSQSPGPLLLTRVTAGLAFLSDAPPCHGRAWPSPLDPKAPRSRRDPRVEPR